MASLQDKRIEDGVRPGEGAPPLPAGGFVTLEGEAYYRIAGYDRMPPFMIVVASDTDLWMFITSGGGLTAGRVDVDGALFPYETVDKLHDAHHHTGPITLLRVRGSTGSAVLWQPFATLPGEDAPIERNLYKNVIGNRLVFEEIHRGLGLSFRYRWSACDAFGHVRTATLMNLGGEPLSVSLLDGLRNVLPFGAPLALYEHASSLVDAYKRSECDAEADLGIFGLAARILDRAEAAEMLRANTVWCHGLERFGVALRAEAIDAFRLGEPVSAERLVTGRRGHYLVHTALDLAAGASVRWHLAADAGRSQAQVAALRARLMRDPDLGRAIDAELDAASENLRGLVGSADGLQLGRRAESSAHHFANVLFNIMRGGVLEHDHDIRRDDLEAFLRTRQRRVAERHAGRLAMLPATVTVTALLEAAARGADPDLERLCHEYLPIHFGRRHGDPSRPWNQFTIRVKNPDGGRALHYEGNWRDIFQNWEALSVSFPGFLPGMIAKFVNASTVDGFNPYRITRDGIDWEVVDPTDPWSHIGYWGDHQIVYLLKYLEWQNRFSPGTLEGLLDRAIFSYADVPYRLLPYERLLEDPHETIQYDRVLAARIDERVRAIGTDGRLVVDETGAVVHVTLLEKLLVPALSKLSNLVPDGGIWMNTQRPEWNDANNALVGHGVSVVTLCYLRRYLRFVEQLLEGAGQQPVSMSSEVVRWGRRICAIFEAERATLRAGTVDERDRMRMLDAVGGAFSDYRQQVYAHGFSGKEMLPAVEITGWCRSALEHVDHAIRANRRDDDLYHSYNLLELSDDPKRISLRRLDEMLEGQVAALSSGLVTAAEALRTLASLFEGRLYRDDQHSFMLYPERRLPGFLDKNVIPEARIRAVPLLARLLEAEDGSVVVRDVDGRCRFHADFANARDLAAALDRLALHDAWRAAVVAGQRAVLDVFEEVFDHHSFTGRSGTMDGYEGLGSVYWHMVAKLLLAVQEVHFRAVREGQPEAMIDALAGYYFRIRAGLGFEKSVAEYGAFPTDPYSHTPAHAGARQPGMTGQVKEEILTRFGELGVEVEGGRLAFRPRLLRRDEFLRDHAMYQYCDLAGLSQALEAPAESLVFSFCQVPVIYRLSQDAAWVKLTPTDGKAVVHAGDRLDAATSRELFERRGTIARIDVGVPERLLTRS